MIESLLVANRGEIAARVIRTASRLGIRTVAVFSEADAGLPFVRLADEAVPIGPAAPAQSYLNIEVILAAAQRTGAVAVHPGYGFLSENAAFARAVVQAGLVWVGPPAEAIEALGDKISARRLVGAAGVPVVPGSTQPVADLAAAMAEAAWLGYPVMVKAAAGGGGLGMAVARDEASLRAGYEQVRGLASRLFGDPAVLVERYFPSVRHIEVQLLGWGQPDQPGRIMALGERECSVQRRNQKLVEECPSPAASLTPARRTALHAAAVRVGETVDYRSAGTVEFLLEPTTGEFFFLEMNTRLQVEHPVTEAVFGVDLVEEQLRIASGLAPTVDARACVPLGHAIELRINAEDPQRFLPGPGTITTWQPPTGPGVRVDAGYAAGTTVTPHYDSLMAKLVVHAASRDEAIERARAAVAAFQITGPKHNLAFHAELLGAAQFRSGDYDTGIVARIREAAAVRQSQRDQTVTGT